MGRPRLTPEQYLTRFWAKVVRRPNGCWTWVGAVSASGYGTVGVWDAEGVHHNKGPHQVLYEILKGAVTEGKELHHTCENKLCVNPGHLQPVTRLQHRRIRMREFCPCGLAYDRVTKVGARMCSVCQRTRQIRWKEALASTQQVG